MIKTIEFECCFVKNQYCPIRQSFQLVFYSVLSWCTGVNFTIIFLQCHHKSFFFWLIDYLAKELESAKANLSENCFAFQSNNCWCKNTDWWTYTQNDEGISCNAKHRDRFHFHSQKENEHTDEYPHFQLLFCEAKLIVRYVCIFLCFFLVCLCP